MYDHHTSIEQNPYAIVCYRCNNLSYSALSYLNLYTGEGSRITSAEGNPKTAVFGVPFDSTHSYKPGTRFGPDSIRESFNNIEVFHPELGVDLEDTAIADYGNITHTVVSDEMLKMVGRTTSELLAKNLGVIILGGEHLLTLGSYLQMPKDTAYVVFDAHYDLRDSYAGAHNSHASYLRRISESHDTKDIIHVGARAFVADELAFLKESNITTITDSDIRAEKGPKLLADALSSYKNVYTSFDLDVLDPAFAPGVGNPEACGITSRELFSMIDALADTRVVCADIVELNPSCDTGATTALAAKIMSVLVAMQTKY